MPKSPAKYIDLNEIGHGVMFHGTKGSLIAGFDTRVLLPMGDKADMTYYKPRPEEQLIPPLGHFQKEWINACKGDLKTSCDFDYSGDMIEQLLLGLVAYRHGAKIEYDGAAGRITNDDAANRLLRQTYRDGWTLDG
jgi:hypothetical protein